MNERNAALCCVQQWFCTLMCFWLRHAASLKGLLRTAVKFPTVFIVNYQVKKSTRKTLSGSVKNRQEISNNVICIGKSFCNSFMHFIFIHSLIFHAFVHSFICSFIPLFFHSFLIHSFVHSFVFSSIHFFHLSIHLYIRPFIHW